VFGELELAAVVDHLGADSSVDEIFDGKQTRRAEVGGAVARADHGEIRHARGQRR